MLDEKKSLSDAEGAGGLPDFSHIDEKKTLRKMDLHLIPIMSLLYLLAFLDRGNIGNAKIEGLAEDLRLSGSQYNWCRKLTPSPRFCEKFDPKLSIYFFICSNRLLFPLCIL